MSASKESLSRIDQLRRLGRVMDRCVSDNPLRSLFNFQGLLNRPSPAGVEFLREVNRFEEMALRVVPTFPVAYRVQCSPTLIFASICRRLRVQTLPLKEWTPTA